MVRPRSAAGRPTVRRRYLAARWARSTRSRTRRAASARRPPRSTSRRASPRPATRRCSSTSTRRPTPPSAWARRRTVGPNVYDVLAGRGRRRSTRCATPRSSASGCCPSHPDLAGANVELPREAGLREPPARRARARSATASPTRCSTARRRSGPLTVNALVAADRVIVPVQTEYFALEGLAGLLDTLALIQRELNPRLTVAGMLLTMHDGRTRLGARRRARGARALPLAGLRHGHPAQRARGRGAELRPPGDPPRPALRRVGRLLRAGQGGGAAWLICARRRAARQG